MSTLSADASRQIDAFFDSVSKEDWNSDDHFLSYLAVRHQKQMTLLAGRLRFNLGTKKPVVRRIDDEIVIAGSVALNECGLTPSDLISKLVDGSLDLNGLKLGFPTEAANALTVFHRPNIHLGSRNGRVENALQISGIQKDKIIDYSTVSMALKAYPLFHGNLGHLVNQHSLIPNFGAIGFWLVTSPIVQIEAASQRTKRGLKFVQLALRPGFNPDLVSVGIGFVDSPGSSAVTLVKENIKWKRRSDHHVGITSFDAPLGRQIECVAIYENRVQHVEILKN